MQPAPLPSPLRTPILALALVLALPRAGHADGPPGLDAPAREVLAEAQAIVAGMKGSDRGPYKWIRWYCKDGTVHPARPYPCAERGGGHQYGEYSEARNRLAQLGWPAGTVFTALAFDELWDGDHRNARLRDLALERYLVDVDDGWVLRKARGYRGRVQIEDEEDFGRKLLIELLARSDWVAANYLVARETVRTIPHHGGSDRTRSVRRISKEIAEADATFEPLRVGIHNFPGPADAARVRAWTVAARERGAATDVIASSEGLARELDLLYGIEGRKERLERGRKALLADPEGAGFARLLEGVLEVPPFDRVDRLSSLLARTRDTVTASKDGTRNLLLLDLSIELESELLRSAFEVAGQPGATRVQLVRTATALLDASYGGGFLSSREHDALSLPLAAWSGQTDVPAPEYLAAARGLERAGGWAYASIRHGFGEAMTKFTALEPKAVTFPDDLLRGSALLPLAQVAGTLARDAERLSGLTHRVFGQSVGGLAGLNAGVAVGRLRVVTEDELAKGAPGLARDQVVVLPRLVSELRPVAGILTLQEGNVLSHVQMLARNLGIPNVALAPTFASTIAPHDGESVLLAVGSDGSVVLEPLAKLPEALRTSLLPGGSEKPVETVIQNEAPDLSLRRPLPLAELRSSLSGKVVGPKAANAGELAHQFPGRVAPAIAIPFGLFAAHVTAGPEAPKARLDRAFARSRAGELDAAGLAAEIEEVRKQIRGLTLAAETRAVLLPLMEQAFGPPGTYGLFVRSDTNVEDLPGFTGAGLNLTVANVVGLERQLAAVPEVWASPFTPRAMAWRSKLLARPEEVYPSVLLMQSVPSAKSGVLVTADIATRGEGLTVATAWGVSGAVDGEAAESLVLRPDGSMTLLADAKAPWSRRLRAEGGVTWVPAPMGAVLERAEQDELRKLAAEARERLPPSPGPDGLPLPWDLEFGFVGGKLYLFQVRPLSVRGQAAADRVVRAVAPPPAASGVPVPLGVPPTTAGGAPRPAAAAPGQNGPNGGTR